MPKKEKGMNYAATGVNYDLMDPFKRQAQAAGLSTVNNIKRFGFSEASMSRGESAYLIETPDSYIAQVEEGLGTKNLVADAMYKLTGKSYYDQIAQDGVAMIVNDMITLGALPLSLAMHLAVGSSDWFKDEKRTQDLVDGWKKASMLSRCVWGGGETPTLKGVVNPETVVLAGSAVGIIKPKERLIAANIQDGDQIIIIESSGIHANGLTLARQIADKLPDGYLTKLSDGRSYGEALLDPTVIYVPLIEDCLDKGIDIHYAVNVTGHGWRKFMRATAPFQYVIEKLPKQLPIFDFIRENGPVSVEEAYGNLNMGAGFALYVPEKDAKKVLEVIDSYKGSGNGIVGFIAGHIVRSQEKKVVIKPLGIDFLGDTLGVR